MGEPSPGPARGRSILYVEDNADNIYLVQRILQRRPHLDVVIATTGEEGLRLAASSAPGLILLDRRLPDLPGEDVLRRLKDDARTGDIPVVMLSGDTAQEYADDARHLGAHAFLAKPFDIHQFLAVIDIYCPDGSG